MLKCYKTNPKVLPLSAFPLMEICRFINREGIDFSDAQSMQAIQVCRLNTSQDQSFLTLFSLMYMNFVFSLGVGFGRKFTRSLGIPDKVNSVFLVHIIAKNI